MFLEDVAPRNKPRMSSKRFEEEIFSTGEFRPLCLNFYSEKFYDHWLCVE